MQVPKGVVHAVEEGIKDLFDQAVRGKRAKGSIGVEKELNKEIVKTQEYRNLIRLSKCMIYA